MQTARVPMFLVPLDANSVDGDESDVELRTSEEKMNGRNVVDVHVCVDERDTTGKCEPRREEEALNLYLSETKSV